MASHCRGLQMIPPSFKRMQILLLCMMMVTSSVKTITASADPNSQAMFVFGDSILDSGNNNFLPTLAKANYFPYGIDFPMGATGRFTNGRNPADIIGELLGLPHFLPTFSDTLTGAVSIISGVNYASSAAGVLDSTSQTANVTSLSAQISNFLNVTLPNLKSELKDVFPSYVSHDIFLFSFGGVDYLICWNNSIGFSAACGRQSYAESLVQNYTKQLKRLYYESGARKFVVIDVNLNGCLPFFLRQNNGSCLSTLNNAISLFNHELWSGLDGLSRTLPGFSYVYVNMSGIVSRIIKDQEAYGLQVVTESCCPPTNSSGFRVCIQGAEPCADRDVYAFYDPVHPTEKLYLQLSERAYFSELKTEAYPFSINVLTDRT